MPQTTDPLSQLLFHAPLSTFLEALKQLSSPPPASLLHTACKAHHPLAARHLVARFPELWGEKNTLGELPLESAIRGENLDGVEALLDTSLCEHSLGPKSPLWWSCLALCLKKGALSLATKWLAQTHRWDGERGEAWKIEGSELRIGERKQSLTHRAVKRKDISVLEALFLHHSDHAPDAQGDTPLHLASQLIAQDPSAYHQRLFQTLIRYGASADPLNAKGQTPLSLHPTLPHLFSQCVEELFRLEYGPHYLDATLREELVEEILPPELPYLIFPLGPNKATLCWLDGETESLQEQVVQGSFLQMRQALDRLVLQNVIGPRVKEKWPGSWMDAPFPLRPHHFLPLSPSETPQRGVDHIVLYGESQEGKLYASYYDAKGAQIHSLPIQTWRKRDFFQEVIDLKANIVREFEKTLEEVHTRFGNLIHQEPNRGAIWVEPEGWRRRHRICWRDPLNGHLTAITTRGFGADELKSSLALAQKSRLHGEKIAFQPRKKELSGVITPDTSTIEKQLKGSRSVDAVISFDPQAKRLYTFGGTKGLLLSRSLKKASLDQLLETAPSEHWLEENLREKGCTWKVLWQSQTLEPHSVCLFSSDEELWCVAYAHPTQFGQVIIQEATSSSLEEMERIILQGWNLHQGKDLIEQLVSRGTGYWSWNVEHPPTLHDFHGEPAHYLVLWFASQHNLFHIFYRHPKSLQLGWIPSQGHAFLEKEIQDISQKLQGCT